MFRCQRQTWAGLQNRINEDASASPNSTLPEDMMTKERYPKPARAIGYDEMMLYTDQLALKVQEYAPDEIIGVARSGLPFATFIAQKLEAAAGVKQAMLLWAKNRTDVRPIDEPFMQINQAMGTPQTRGEAGKKYLRAFIEEMKASGFVAKALERSGQADATVAPAAN